VAILSSELADALGVETPSAHSSSDGSAEEQPEPPPPRLPLKSCLVADRHLGSQMMHALSSKKVVHFGACEPLFCLP
jgi:hypothetical protein